MRWARGCSIGCLTIMLLFGVLILTMCHVPKAEYGSYITAGNRYYRTVLGIAPKITHDWMFADEDGGFDITVKLTKEQRKKALTRLYMKSMSGDSEYSFRALRQLLILLAYQNRKQCFWSSPTNIQNSINQFLKC